MCGIRTLSVELRYRLSTLVVRISMFPLMGRTLHMWPCHRSTKALPEGCGLLKKHMYGTRAAADGWQQEYSGFLRSIGFVQWKASPCLFTHKARNIATSVHGDDLTSSGPKVKLDWLESQLEGKYELRKGGRLGLGDQDAKEILVLNRAIRWTEQGLECEADPRQGERLFEGLGA